MSSSRSRGRNWIEDFAHVVAIPGSQAQLLDERNVLMGQAPIWQAVAEGWPFFVFARPDLLVLDGDHPLAPIDVELLALRLELLGISSVIVASGHPDEPWRRHLFATVPADDLRESLRTIAEKLRFDVRRGNQGMRPPLSPHRLGGSSLLVEPTSPMEALGILSPTPRVLSERILRLIFYGDEAARYPSRSEADMAVAVAIANARGTREHLECVLRSPTSGVGEKYRERGERGRADYLRRTWNAAEQRVLNNPPTEPETAAQRTARRTIRTIDQATQLDPRMWRGTGGSNARRLLFEFLDIGRRKGSTEVGMSVRQGAEAIGCTRSSAYRALNTLQGLGFLKRILRGQMLRGSEWKLRIPSALVGTAFPQQRGGVREDCPTSCVCRDLWRYKVLGPRKRDVWKLLSTEPTSSAVIAEVLGIGRRQAQKHLRALATHGLAVETTGWELGPTDPHDLVHELGVAGLGEETRQAHQEERADYYRRVSTRRAASSPN